MSTTNSDNSVLVESSAEDPTPNTPPGEIQSTVPCPGGIISSPLNLTRKPLDSSTPKTSNMRDTNMEKILEALDDLLDKKLAKQKAEFIEEVSRKFKNEIDELNGRIFQLQQDNENLKQRVAYLEKERQTEKDNVASAKAHAIELPWPFLPKDEDDFSRFSIL